MGIGGPDFDATGWVPFFLQTADALFPTGAYAHSLGFEEVVRLGLVKDEESLRNFLIQQIAPALEHQELPYFRLAYNAATLEELCSLDREVDAWKLAKETREASAQLGGRRLKALRAISDAPCLEEFGEAVQDWRANGHHLVVCALQAKAEGVPLAAALAAYFYQSMAAICAAALKLIRIGQDGCQRSLRAACGIADAVLRNSLAIEREDAGWFNPMLEIASMRHERAGERLFIS